MHGNRTDIARTVNGPRKSRIWTAVRSGLVAFAFGCAGISTFANAGDFTMNLGTNPNWPTAGLGPVNFTMTDQFGFQLDGTAQITRFGGTGLAGWPDETNIFGTATSVGVVYDSGAGNGSVGEATNTATLSFSSGGSPFGVDSLSFIISDIDSVDNNSTTDRCDFVTVTGNAGNPALSYVSPTPATRSVILGPGAGSGATGALAANQAQCIYNIGATGSPNSTADDNGSILAVWPAGTSTANVLYDESIENVLGVTNLNAAARGIGVWAGSVITVNQNISLVKVADVTSYVGAGETITYTYTVTNDGPLPINAGQNIQINDDRVGLFNCPAIGSAIGVGGTHVCTANYNTTAGDATAADVVNIATAGVGTGAQAFATRLQSNSDSATVIREIPAISLSKSAGTPSVAAGGNVTLTDGGDTIVYTYTVTNTGNVPVFNVSITDPGPTFNGNAGTGTLSAFSPASATIAVGANQIFTATYTLSQLDVDNSAGIINAVANTANSAGNSVGGVPATSNNSSANTTISGGPAIIVTKTASPDSDVPVGVTVTYTYRVTNTGNQTISNISLSDAHGGSGPAPTPAGEILFADNGPLGDSTDAASNGIWDSLAPGDVIEFTGVYVVTQNDIDTLQ
ncbi:MAG: beta strand repeat-containing protein [Rhizobiaceae bacterium]